MFGFKKRKKLVIQQRSTLPESAIEEATRQIQGLDDRRIEARLEGKYLYVDAKGDPLCRFKYEGSDTEWRFALYRYTRGGYSNDVVPYPDKNRIDEGIRVALRIYNME
jgi:hypothetical protein